MGGIWGLAAATCLFKIYPWKSVVSQAVWSNRAIELDISSLPPVINLTLVPETRKSWRSLFWCAAGISAFIRTLLPESAMFLRAKKLEKERGMTTSIPRKQD